MTVLYDMDGNPLAPTNPPPDAEDEDGRPKTDKELFDLAIGIVAGTVFTSQHLRHEEDVRLLPTIFGPLGVLTPAERQELAKANVAVFYAHVSESGGGQVRGRDGHPYPTFEGVHFLMDDEAGKLQDWLRKIGELDPDPQAAAPALAVQS